jgi:hypothetical protein
MKSSFEIMISLPNKDFFCCCLYKLFFNRTRFGPYEWCYSPSMLHALPKEEEIFFVVRRYEASVLER